MEERTILKNVFRYFFGDFKLFVILRVSIVFLLVRHARSDEDFAS